ncbi:MAG: VanZ family protein [Acidobacteriota bacterium]
MVDLVSSLARRQRRLFGAAALVMLSIYAMAAFGRPVANVLRAQGMLRFFVAALFVTAAVVGVVWVLKNGRRPNRRELLLFGALGLVYGLFLFRMTYPEEAFHFLEYGLLGALLLAGFALRRPLRPAAWLAFGATAFLGWTDELLQHFVPERFFDWRDVALNAFAGLLAIVASVLWERWARPAAGS